LLTIENIFQVTNENFENLALSIFKLQFEQIEVYQEYCKIMGKSPDSVQSLSDIPFLPIDIFKTHHVISKSAIPELIFESSATTGQTTSKHQIIDVSIYETSFLKTFKMFYGAPDEYIFLALLPSYLERNNSSLVYMTDRLIKESKNTQSGFFMNNFEELNNQIQLSKNSEKKIFIIGVTYALLDFSEQYPLDLSNATVMETGGMKGRRKEMVRDEIHTFLKNKLKVEKVHSEYGMTELLSQAYSKGDGIFSCPPWMKVFIRDSYDPTQFSETGSGGINIIDLANINSCSFIATGDLGRKTNKDSFEVLGRLQDAEVRGCNLMYN
jgi:phenylacetate-coenzyme A ligase PaaK-like adenylate-forming protein